MSRQRRPHPLRPLAVVAMLALASLLAAACGSDGGGGVATPGEGQAGAAGGGTGTDGGTDGEPTGGGETGVGGGTSDFCGQVSGIEGDLALLSDATVPDPAAYPDLIDRAAERFASVEPPTVVAGSWQRVADFLTFAGDAFEGVEVRSQEDLSDALEAAGEEAFGMVLTLPGQIETVGAFIQDECGVDLGIAPPVVYDACPLVDDVHLASVFAEGAAPEGRPMPWGGGVVECTWEDEDGNEVGLVVAPAPAVESDLVGGMTPIDTSNVDDLVIEVYDGAIGPFRSQAGRTAATVAGDVGVAVSVVTGDHATEASKATALVSMVALELP